MIDADDRPSMAVKERAMDEAPVGITISDPDRDDNPLVYVNQAFERVTGYPAEEVIGRNCRFLQGEETDEAPVNQLREAIDAGEPVTVELLNYRNDGEPFWNEVTVAPVRDDSGEITHFVGFQDDVTRRKEAEIALREERERLDHLLDRVAGMLEAVAEAVIVSTSRDDLEQGLCDHLVETADYEAAWITSPEAATDVLEPTAWATADAEHPWSDPGGDGPPSVPVDADHLIARALRERTVELDVDPSGAEWGEEGVPMAADAGGALAAIPIEYRDATYGVLTIIATEKEAFDDRERTVFLAVGRAIGAAMSVIESRRILTADTVVELELELTDPALFFVHLSNEADCSLAYAGSVVREDGQALFFTVTGADGATLDAAAADCDEIASLTVLAENDTSCRIEVEPAADSLVGRLAERGARTEGLAVEDERATLTLTLPEEADVRRVFELIKERHPGTSLLSTTRRERTPETRGEYIERIEERLTDRQFTALQTAYAAGYFDRPRGATGDEVAAAMGVGRSTFHQHLRAAERKLLSAFLDR